MLSKFYVGECYGRTIPPSTNKIQKLLLYSDTAVAFIVISDPHTSWPTFFNYKYTYM
jgi:hypothetical protein